MIHALYSGSTIDMARQKKTAKIVDDMQGDLPRSMIGRRVTIVSRQRSQDVDGDEAFAAIPKGWKNPRLFWKEELKFDK
jgi:hypothetical protein